jgi:Fe-S cluster biogenesis protein NfuA
VEARIDRAKVAEAIEMIRPAVQVDGGDIEMRDVDEATGVVTVALTGACVACPSSTVTLKAGVERILMDRVPGVTAVEAAGAESETILAL